MADIKDPVIIDTVVLDKELADWQDVTISEENCDNITMRLRQVNGVNTKLANANIDLADEIDANRTKFKNDTIVKIQVAKAEKIVEEEKIIAEEESREAEEIARLAAEEIIEPEPEIIVPK